jgi:hypothetical protein
VKLRELLSGGEWFCMAYFLFTLSRGRVSGFDTRKSTLSSQRRGTADKRDTMKRRMCRSGVLTWQVISQDNRIFDRQKMYRWATRGGSPDHVGIFRVSERATFWNTYQTKIDIPHGK